MELCNGFGLNNTLDSDTARGAVRFEPITVRAAVRVIRLQRAGVVSGVEADFYISELAAMDRHTGARGAGVLARMARRQATPQRTTKQSPKASWLAARSEFRLALAA
jgi:hypothetical protein